MTVENVAANSNAHNPFELLKSYAGRYQVKQKIPFKRQRAEASYLSFLAGEKRYLIDMKMVLQVVMDVGEITPLPFSPVWLLGLASLRGDVYSVIDFKCFVDRKKGLSNAKTSGYIVLRGDSQGYIFKFEEVLGLRAYRVGPFDSPYDWLDGFANEEGVDWYRIDLQNLMTNTSFIQNIH